MEKRYGESFHHLIISEKSSHVTESAVPCLIENLNISIKKWYLTADILQHKWKSPDYKKIPVPHKPGM